VLKLGVVPTDPLTVTCLDGNSAEAFWRGRDRRGRDDQGALLPLPTGVWYLDEERRIVVRADDFEACDDHELAVPVAGCFVTHLLVSQAHPPQARRLLRWLETRLDLVWAVLEWANTCEPDPDDLVMVLEAFMAIVCTHEPLPDEEEDLEDDGIGMTSLFREGLTVVRASLRGAPIAAVPRPQKAGARCWPSPDHRPPTHGADG
jgi:hypothetical protein